MIFKCKMCGGALNVQSGATVCECEYCGSRQTLPRLDDEKRAALFERANFYRARCEFDKAALIYESILNEAPDEAEAHWGTVLCRYGIEYVEDPRTKRRVPTCHRTQFKSILEDVDYLAAVKGADILAREVYTAEAEYIDKVQKGILAISSKEAPFDIFICYKESDERGERTIDSVIAQDIYDALNSRGYKVFFSRITLEDKLGSAYEPYIFAALNSAKIMLVCGTDPSHFNAVWVKNEWSRYLALIEGGAKKTVIPCYRDITPYDLPDEFVALQGQDMGKVGAMQDLLRGIEKILGAKSAPAPERNKVSDDAIPKALSANDFEIARMLIDAQLKANPEDGEAHYYALLCEYKVKKLTELPHDVNWMEDKLFSRALRYATVQVREEMNAFNKLCINQRSFEMAQRFYDEGEFDNAARIFQSLGEFRTSAKLARAARAKKKLLHELGDKDTYIERKMTERYPDLVRKYQTVDNQSMKNNYRNNGIFYLIACIAMVVASFIAYQAGDSEQSLVCTGVWSAGLMYLWICWNGDIILDFSDFIKYLIKSALLSVVMIFIISILNGFIGIEPVFTVMLALGVLFLIVEIWNLTKKARYGTNEKQLGGMRNTEVAPKVSEIRHELILKYQNDIPEVVNIVNKLANPFK